MTTPDFESCLIKAVVSGDETETERLFQENGHLLLEIAERSKKYNMISYLLESGIRAAPELIGYYLVQAVIEGDAESVRRLVKLLPGDKESTQNEAPQGLESQLTCPPTKRQSPFRKALVEAATYNRKEIMEILLDDGADFRFDTETPLITAILKSSLEVIELLLDRGANLHVDNDFPLRMAQLGGKIDSMKLLIQRGANIRVYEDCLIVTACEVGNLEILKVLIESASSSGEKYSMLHTREDHLFKMVLKPEIAEYLQMLKEEEAFQSDS